MSTPDGRAGNGANLPPRTTYGLKLTNDRCVHLRCRECGEEIAHGATACGFLDYAAAHLREHYPSGPSWAEWECLETPPEWPSRTWHVFAEYPAPWDHFYVTKCFRWDPSQ